jgi:hypothetical protein
VKGRGLLDHDHARASALLEEVARTHPPPEDLLLAASVYVDRARAMLDATATEGDGPPSLAPHVVATEVSKESGDR